MFRTIGIAVAVVTVFAMGVFVGARDIVIREKLVYIQPETEVILPAKQEFAFQYPKKPTKSQQQLLGMAYDIAQKDGHAEPQILQAVILQETHAGTVKRFRVVGQEYGLVPMKRYYGVSQIKLAATWDVMKRWPELWTKFGFQTRTDDELIAKLIENDKFNMTVASKYLLVLQSYGYTTTNQQLTAYNKGPGGAEGVDADTNEYALSAQSKLTTMVVNNQ